MREVSTELLRGKGLNAIGGLILSLFLTLIANKEEETVFPMDQMRNCNGSAKGSAVLIALENIAWQQLSWCTFIEEGVGVERVIANKVESTSVPFVCAGLCYDSDDAAAVAPIFRGVIVFENAKFGDGVRVRIVDHAVGKLLVIQAAIQQEGDRVRASAADIVGSRAAVLSETARHYGRSTAYP
jgi:hypothetical protein